MTTADAARAARGARDRRGAVSARRALAAALDTGDVGAGAAARTRGLATIGRPFSPQYPLWSDGAAKTALGLSAAGDDHRCHRCGCVGASRSGRGSGRSSRSTAARSRRVFSGRRRRRGGCSRATCGTTTGPTRCCAPDEGIPAVAEDCARPRATASRRPTDCLACHGTQPHGTARVQRAATLDRSRSERHSRRAARAGHGDAHDARRGRRLRRRARIWSRTRRASQTGNPRRARCSATLAANCGGCHNGDGEIAALGPSLRHGDLLRDGDARRASLVGHPTNGRCPGCPRAPACSSTRRPEKSAMLVRMRSRRPSSQMPPLGTVVRDEAAVEALSRWIGGDLAGVTQKHSPVAAHGSRMSRLQTMWGPSACHRMDSTDARS